MAAPRKQVLNIDDNPSWFNLLHHHNKLVSDLWYFMRNRLGTLVPALAKGSNNVSVKTTNAIQYIRGGVPRAQLAAQDNFFDLTTAGQGVAVVPASSFINYRCIITAAEAQKVQSSTVAATAAACDFGLTPLADGDVVVGTTLVATDGAHTFTPGTTSLSAAGITTTFTDGLDGSEMLASILTE